MAEGGAGAEGALMRVCGVRWMVGIAMKEVCRLGWDVVNHGVALGHDADGFRRDSWRMLRRD